MISIMIAYTHTYTLTCSPLIQNLQIQKNERKNERKERTKKEGGKERKEIGMTSADAGRADATCNMPYAIMRCTPKGHDEISF